MMADLSLIAAAVVCSVLSTARKQGWNMLQTLNSVPSRLIAGLRLV
jgi:hypothetical protein